MKASTHGNQYGRTAARGKRLSRRAFLGAAGVVGTAAALGGVLGPGQAGAATASPLAGPRGGRAASQPAYGPVGATVQSGVYLKAHNRYHAANIFDGYVGRPAATTVQKWYFNEGRWPSSVPADMAQLSAAGCKFIMCFKPIRSPLTPSEGTNLQNTCNMFINHQPAPIDFDVVLWQEPNSANKDYFSSGSDYIAYVQYYRPYVPSGVSIIYDSAGSASASDQQGYFPGSALVDKVYCDFYGCAYKAKLSDGIQNPLHTLEQVADGNGLPFGLSEWGYGSARTALTPTSTPSASQYVSYINTVFTSRLTAGKVNGAVLYYDGDSSSAPWNVISGPKDWKTPLFQEIYDDLTSTS
jgi:hypothetical protein